MFSRRAKSIRGGIYALCVHSFVQLFKPVFMKAMKGQQVGTQIRKRNRCYRYNTIFILHTSDTERICGRSMNGIASGVIICDTRDARHPKFAARHFRHFKLKPASQHRAFKFQHGERDLRIPSLHAKAHPFQHNRPAVPPIEKRC